MKQDSKLLSIIHNIMHIQPTDAMDIIIIVIDYIYNIEDLQDNEKYNCIQDILKYLINDSCELDLNINIRLPIKCVLEQHGLLNGIIRYRI